MKIRKNIIITLVTLFIVFVIVASFLKNSNVLKSQNLFTSILHNQKEQNEFLTEDSSSFTKTSESDELSTIDSKISQFYYGVALHNMSDTVNADGYDYRVNSIELTKEKGQFENPDYPEFDFDNNGNLINDYTYFIVDVTVQFKKEVYDEFDELYLNSMKLDIFDTNGEFVDSYEAVSSNNDIDLNNKDHFKLNLKIGESITRKIVYIVKDEELSEKNFILHIANHNALGKHIEDQQCIKLNLEAK